MNRRIGTVLLHEEQLATLLRLPEGHHVIGVAPDWNRMSILLHVEGESMPEHPPGTYPCQVDTDRFYDPRLRQKLNHLVERWDDDKYGRRAEDVLATIAAVLDGDTDPSMEMDPPRAPRVVTVDTTGGPL